VQARAFHAPNGELGIPRTDVEQFLTACDLDHVRVLGWELWLIDHVWRLGAAEPTRFDGDWCGLVPTKESKLPTVVSGGGDSEASRLEIESLQLEQLVDERWLPHLRFNFTLGER
jgi:hypothetical protein